MLSIELLRFENKLKLYGDRPPHLVKPAIN